MSIDHGIATLSRPTAARVCIQLNVLKEYPTRVWVDCGDAYSSFWKSIEYEVIPSNCKHCRRLGHDVSKCKDSEHAKETRKEAVNQDEDKQGKPGTGKDA